MIAGGELTPIGFGLIIFEAITAAAVSISSLLSSIGVEFIWEAITFNLSTT